MLGLCTRHFEKAQKFQVILSCTQFIINYNLLIIYRVFLDNGKCLGWRENISKPFQWIHYNETLLRARNFGSGLLGLGFPKANQIFIGIFSQNCPEWILTEQAAYCFSMVVVPLYDTLGPEACSFIINQGIVSIIMYFVWNYVNTASQYLIPLR